MSIKLGVVMDPIGTINIAKDSSFAMLLEAKTRGWQLYYLEQRDLYVRNDIAYGNAGLLQVFNNEQKWFAVEEKMQMSLADLDIILMRKDPPFNNQYIYTTYILSLAERQGVLVVNRTDALRDCNEKFYITHFPECIPPTLITQSKGMLFAFLQEYKDIVCKPLSGMGGTNVFRLREGDSNAHAIFDLLTESESLSIEAQRFIPEITQGDKRILIVNGKPVPYALARVPQGEGWYGNLARGAKGVIQPLSERDHYICAKLSADFIKRGLYFVGIDVIGDYLTEINITSPTGIRQIDNGAQLNVSALLYDAIMPFINKSS